MFFFYFFDKINIVIFMTLLTSIAIDTLQADNLFLESFVIYYSVPIKRKNTHIFFNSRVKS